MVCVLVSVCHSHSIQCLYDMHCHRLYAVVRPCLQISLWCPVSDSAIVQCQYSVMNNVLFLQLTAGNRNDLCCDCM